MTTPKKHTVRSNAIREIRRKLGPAARQGVDFTVHGDKKRGYWCTPDAPQPRLMESPATERKKVRGKRQDAETPKPQSTKQAEPETPDNGAAPGAAAGPGNDHNHTVTDLSLDQKQALHFRHVRSYEAALAEKKAAAKRFTDACKIIKAEGGKVAQIKRTIEMRTPEGEARVKEEIAEIAEVCQWNGVGVQTEMFPEDRTPGADKAFAEGKRVGLKGETANPPHAPGTEFYNRYMEGFHEGQAVLARGFATMAPMDDGFSDAMPDATTH